MTTIYKLSLASVQKMAGVHPHLIKAVIYAIGVSDIDFRVLEGLRQPSRQAKLVKTGASKTMNSRHLPGQDGFGHAVDLGALIDFDGDGDLDLRWDWPLYYRVAAAMRKASIELKVPIRWGGVWDRQLAELGESANDLAKAVQAYCARHAGDDFIDGPHFELPAALYG
jgi:peptidoglycan L-alanyl-D-glutamate endopeptidase CwlK